MGAALETVAEMVTPSSQWSEPQSNTGAALPEARWRYRCADGILAARSVTEASQAAEW
eukprot:CAMPEP_0183359452 /NCGR_PEP_ID=MMETSP0164_2-20130417/52234_1 /TAXON_ID=221442 /ORGANISM="Coccolithus pelagicus ssp braarudi, Strain PLY182g" /LENGTH=57 /DNA_ID=CAMNT_0025533561 /DNA_START=34 /DNA_END=207 /DNA_ORIENTATION=+